MATVMTALLSMSKDESQTLCKIFHKIMNIIKNDLLLTQLLTFSRQSIHSDIFPILIHKTLCKASANSHFLGFSLITCKPEGRATLNINDLSQIEKYIPARTIPINST